MIKTTTYINRCLLNPKSSSGCSPDLSDWIKTRAGREPIEPSMQIRKMFVHT